MNGFVAAFAEAGMNGFVAKPVLDGQRLYKVMEDLFEVAPQRTCGKTPAAPEDEGSSSDVVIDPDVLAGLAASVGPETMAKLRDRFQSDIESAVAQIVESVGQYRATAFSIGSAKRRFLGDGLRTRIDHAVADRRILRPERHQPPSKSDQLPCVAVSPDCSDFLRGRDVVPGCKIRCCLRTEQSGCRLRR